MVPPPKRSIVFFLIEDFTMMAFATALEPLRAANRMLGYEAYRWRLASAQGKPVHASNGVECAVDTSLEDERRMMTGPDRPTMVVVCSGVGIENSCEHFVNAVHCCGLKSYCRARGKINSVMDVEHAVRRLRRGKGRCG